MMELLRNELDKRALRFGKRRLGSLQRRFGDCCFFSLVLVVAQIADSPRTHARHGCSQQEEARGAQVRAFAVSLLSPFSRQINNARTHSAIIRQTRAQVKAPKADTKAKGKVAAKKPAAKKPAAKAAPKAAAAAAADAKPKAEEKKAGASSRSCVCVCV